MDMDQTNLGLTLNESQEVLNLFINYDSLKHSDERGVGEKGFSSQARTLTGKLQQTRFAKVHNE